MLPSLIAAAALVAAAPTHVTLPGTKTLTYTVSLTAPDADERVDARVDTPRAFDGSSPLIGPPAMQLTGPTVLEASGSGIAYPSCSPRARPYGAEPTMASYRLLLPAATTTQLRLRYALVQAPRPPRPDLRVTVRIASQVVRGGPARVAVRRGGVLTSVVAPSRPRYGCPRTFRVVP
jgi:hypothetical protein